MNKMMKEIQFSLRTFFSKDAIQDMYLTMIPLECFLSTGSTCILIDMHLMVCLPSLHISPISDRSS